jgi:peptidyl-prolyl cis-trans isomerase C
VDPRVDVDARDKTPGSASEPDGTANGSSASTEAASPAEGATAAGSPAGSTEDTAKPADPATGSANGTATAGSAPASPPAAEPAAQAGEPAEAEPAAQTKVEEPAKAEPVAKAEEPAKAEPVAKTEPVAEAKVEEPATAEPVAKAEEPAKAEPVAKAEEPAKAEPVAKAEESAKAEETKVEEPAKAEPAAKVEEPAKAEEAEAPEPDKTDESRAAASAEDGGGKEKSGGTAVAAAAAGTAVAAAGAKAVSDKAEDKPDAKADDKADAKADDKADAKADDKADAKADADKAEDKTDAKAEDKDGEPKAVAAAGRGGVAGLLSTTKGKAIAGAAAVVVIGAAVGGYLWYHNTHVPSDVAFRVYGQNVSIAQLTDEVQTDQALYGFQPPANGPKLAQFKKDFAKATAVSMVIDHAAADKGITVADRQVQDTLARYITQVYGPGDDGHTKFVQDLANKGTSEPKVLAELKRQITLTQLTQQVSAGIQVSDQDVQQYFTQHQAQLGTPERRDLHNMVVANQAQADQIVAQLKAGGNFEQLAQQNSLDTSTKDQGGELGLVAQAELEPSYAQAAFSAPVNGIYGPVQGAHGFNIGKVVSIQPPAPAVFAQIKDQLREQMIQDRAAAKWRDYLSTQIKDAGVVYNPDYRPQDPDGLPSAGPAPDGQQGPGGQPAPDGQQAPDGQPSPDGQAPGGQPAPPK